MKKLGDYFTKKYSNKKIAADIELFLIKTVLLCTVLNKVTANNV